MTDANNDLKVNPNFQYFRIFKSITAKTYARNNTPCTIPITRFGSGICSIYFNGIVIKSISKKESPSVKAMILNRPIGVLRSWKLESESLDFDCISI